MSHATMIDEENCKRNFLSSPKRPCTTFCFSFSPFFLTFYISFFSLVPSFISFFCLVSSVLHSFLFVSSFMFNCFYVHFFFSVHFFHSVLISFLLSYFSFEARWLRFLTFKFGVVGSIPAWNFGLDSSLRHKYWLVPGS